MKINLNLLKFHSFNYSKNLHNKISTNKIDEYFNKLFGQKNLLKTFSIIYKIDNFKNMQSNLKSLNYHSIENNKKEDLIKIIKKCHPSLYLDLVQLYENKNISKIKFHQVKIAKKERLIFIQYKDLNNIESIIPIIFDLNHCIYKNKDKNFDNNKAIYGWNFKHKQKQIKEHLENNIK